MLGRETAARREELIQVLAAENAALKQAIAFLPRERRALLGQLDILLTSVVLDRDRGQLVIWRKDKLQAELPIVPESLQAFLQAPLPNHPLTVQAKLKNPIPNRPEWAYTDINLEIPPLNSPERLMKGALGDLAVYCDQRLIIHSVATDRAGHNQVKHHCLELAQKRMARLYRTVFVGTPIVFP